MLGLQWGLEENVEWAHGNSMKCSHSCWVWREDKMKREEQFILASLLGRGWMWEIFCSHGPVSCLASEWRRIWESRIVIWDYRGCRMPELGCLLMQACGQAGTFCWHFPQIISCVLPFPHSVTDYHLLLIFYVQNSPM